ncbi:MAG: hypothetical protein A2176_10330 [Spirochaetes bacterium RBG_13_51_14]|nr:MAG: hypothetical protein A2176_10330 [Spirochaetes bacterium RBG_13_51_14]
MVAARAVASATKWLTSPSPEVSLLNESLMASPMKRWMNLIRNVRNKCVPNRMISIGGPHR